MDNSFKLSEAQLRAKHKYNHSKKGLISNIYQSQKTLSIKRGMGLPKYTKAELIKWMFNNNNFHKLYNDWVLSNYNRWKTPSCDRINDYMGYSFDNIKLGTWKENFDKGHLYRKTGLNNKQNKSVLQINFTGNLIAKYYSAAQASRKNKFSQGNISMVCRGERKSAYGFIWKYA